jgi:serine/threonine protein kinase
VKRQIVKREIETLRRLSHPSIIKMIKQIDNRDTLNIVMEYGGRVTVKEHLSVLKLKNSKLYES